MDALADLLDGVRARTAAFCHTVLEPPWGLRIADEAPLALATPLRGHAWLVHRDGEPVLIRTGDVVVVKGPDHYTVADQPGTPPSVVVHAGNRLTTVDGADATTLLQRSPFASARGHDLGDVPDGATLVASGAYQITGDVSGRLLAALPRVVHVPADEASGPVLQLLVSEIDHPQPGQQVMLDRLLDLALVGTLRAWFNRPDADAPGWYRAQADALVGPALRAMHDDPELPWTVATIAQLAGASRAAFARRFTALVGQPPLTYLTHWRLSLAADLLRHTDTTVEVVARKVGYANAFALTVAFKRVRGVTPRQYRRHPAPLHEGATASTRQPDERPI